MTAKVGCGWISISADPFFTAVILQMMWVGAAFSGGGVDISWRAMCEKVTIICRIVLGGLQLQRGNAFRGASRCILDLKGSQVSEG